MSSLRAFACLKGTMPMTGPMTSRFARAAALAACLSMAATPALARDRGGWGGGWGNGRHHDRGIDGGDILGGLLVIGVIAAVAAAASKADKAKQDDAYRYPDQQRPQYDDRATQESASDPAKRDWGRARSIDGAVDTCVAEVERGSTKVDTVDAVDREGEGWRIAGRTQGGAPYDCAVDGAGQVRSVTVDGKAPFRS